MLLDFLSWCRLRKPRCRCPRRPLRAAARLSVEWLEDRTLLSNSPLAAATPLVFGPLGTAQAAHFLASPTEVDLYRVHLDARDRLSTTVSAQTAGSGLASLLRIFDAAGRPLALDDQEGGDPQLSFQAATAGDYLVGVSSAPNNAYDPTVGDSGTAGGTTGLYQLDLRRTPAAPLQPDLTGSSFRLSADAAEPGDRVPLTFAVENRGAADPGHFQVEILLATNDRFDSSAQLLQTLKRADLTADATGRRFSSPVGFGVTVPAGLPSGPFFVGLRVIPDPAVADASPSDKSGVHAGADFEPLTLVTHVTPVPSVVTDLSPVDPNLRTGADGMLRTPDQSDTFSFTTSGLGSGRLTAEVAATGGTLVPRLTLSGPRGQLLIQSDSGRILQHLEPGNYSLAVSAQAGVGTYRLTTDFTRASLPFTPLAVGTFPRAVAVADVNGDGIPDVITANYISGTVSVLLGNGDGSFQQQQTFAVGMRPSSVVVADVNGDGTPDLVVANRLSNTVSVLLGNGDGSFQQQQTFAAGPTPVAVAVADVNGDGIPDLIVANRDSGMVSVLLGKGRGAFGSPQTFAVGALPLSVAVADVNGDGILDIVTANYANNTVSVLLGDGHGSFQQQQTFPVGPGPAAVAVADVNGDGTPDLVTANYANNTVSVLLGDGHGSFQQQQAFAVGAGPNAVTVADVNGDGRLDLVTANTSDNTVSVLLGNGDGSFQSQQTLAVAARPFAVAVADVNGDGRPDLVTANEYDLSVSVLVGNGDGSFLTPQTFAAAALPFAVAVADVNGDGRPDLVTANQGDGTVSVLVGNADGSFQTQQTFAVGPRPVAVAVADVNGDGRPDLVTANYKNNTVSVLLGNGDGTFQLQKTFAVGGSPDAVAVADVNGDDIPDLIVANRYDGTVSVLLGNGDGTFQPQKTNASGPNPIAVAVADLGNGHRDIITANAAGGTVSVLLGNGDGTFQAQQTFAVGLLPLSVVVADVNGDGRPDLVVANYLSDTVSVLLGNGDGTFQPQQTFAIGRGPDAVAVADLGNGHPDILAGNLKADTVSVLLGDGRGAFPNQQTLAVGRRPTSVAVADVNGDHKPDLITADYRDSTVSVLLGNGDGSFQPRQAFPLGKKLYSVAVADVNGDGKPDLVQTNLHQNTVSVLLGNGAGSFQQQQPLAVGNQPTSVVAADLNGDGRPDLVTTNSDDDTVSVLLGNGDGSFQPQHTLAVGHSPRAVAVADVNGDGKPDLVVANYDDNPAVNDGAVSVLLGNGDGSFGPQQTFRVGQRPYSVAVMDVNGDGHLDLITANAGGDPAVNDGAVSVLLGNGDGTFRPQQTFAVGRQPFSVAVADVNGDGLPDIITANAADNTVSVLLGNGAGSFGKQQVFATGQHPFTVAVLDLNGDRKPDLVTSNLFDGTVSVLLGNGAGSFQRPQTFATDQVPVQTVIADVNGDGRPDLVTASNYDARTGVLMGNGGTFVPSTQTNGGDARNTPYLADLNGDGIPDATVLDRSGNILFRKGLPGADNAFAPPVILNPGRPARDLTLVRTGLGWAVAAADARFDSSLSSPNHFVYTVSLYTVGPDGSVTRSTALATAALPTRLAAADLTGNGLDDLVAANSLDNSVTVALQETPGRFAPAVTHSVGIAPSDIAFADLNGDGRSDIVVSDLDSGDISVLLNDPSHTFATSHRFRAGTGLYDLDTSAASPAVSTREESVSLAAGAFTGTGRNDLVVINRGAHSFSVLTNDGRGGFTNPQTALTFSTSDGLQINDRPGAVVVGDFNRDGFPDLAILMEDRGEVWIYASDGRGHFRHTFSVAAGATPTGLSLGSNLRTGFLDLLVGNPFGDILRLVGNGDGTFQAPPPVTGNRVPLDVADLRGDGKPDVLLANQRTNQLLILTRVPGTTQFTSAATLADGTQMSLLAPGAVQWAKLDRNSSLFDAVVLGSGSNNVLVYRATGFDAAGNPTFAPPRTYPVGQTPTSVTILDVNGDGIPDLLVANTGSNDVSVLFGSYDSNGTWIANPGPRLKSTGSGPIATALRDTNGDGIPDLVVTNQDGTISVLPGIGSNGQGTGFFQDNHATTLTIPGSSGMVSQSGNFLVTDTGAIVNTLTLTTVFSPAPGQSVTAVQALPDGDLVAALLGGTVALLALNPASQTFADVQELTPLTGIPTNPSALAVLETVSEQLVLVTNEGEDQVFVFVLDASGTPAPGGPPIVLPELDVSSSTVAEPTAPSDAPLALVLTLAADNLPSNEPALAGTGTSQIGEGEAAGSAGAAASAAFLSGSNDTGDEPEQVAAAPEEIPRGLDVDDVLRRLDLYEPTPDRPDPNADGPTSGRTVPAVPVPSDQALARFWEALGDFDCRLQIADCRLQLNLQSAICNLQSEKASGEGAASASRGCQPLDSSPEPLTRTTHDESRVDFRLQIEDCRLEDRLRQSAIFNLQSEIGLALPLPESEWNVSVAAPPGPDLDWEQAMLATLAASAAIWWPLPPRLINANHERRGGPAQAL